MSKGNDARTQADRQGQARTSRDAGRSRDGRSSRSSVRITAERARAIQAHADRTGRNQEFKARAMSAADRNDSDEDAS